MDFKNLEARGFGWLIDPALPQEKMQQCGDDKNFSYFTYRIGSTHNVRNEIHKNIEQERAVLLGNDGESENDWIRHWCPILFEDNGINK